MRFHNIQLRNVRRHQPGIRIEDLSSGLNLIGGDNEEGKSSLLLALRCALFLAHGTTGQLREKLVPYGSSLTPEIELDFELGQDMLKLVKQFKKDGVKLTTPSAVLQNADAEAELERRLKFDRPGRAPKELTSDHLGLTGLFWVEQGKSFDAVQPGADGQRRLSDLLSTEIGDVVTGGDTERVLSDAQERFARYWTSQGRAKTAGPLAEAEARLTQSEDELALCREQMNRLKATFEQLSKLRAENLRVVQEDEAGHLRDRLQQAELKAKQLESLRHQQALKQQELSMAQKTRSDLGQQQQQRAKRLDEIQALQSTLDQMRKTQAELTQAVAIADLERQRQNQSEKAIIEKVSFATALVEQAELDDERQKLEKRLVAEQARFVKATAMSQDLQDLQTAISLNPVTAQTLANLQKADRARRDATIKMASAATRIEFKPDGSKNITFAGKSHDPGTYLDLSEPGDIGLEGFGHIRIIPGGEEVRQSRSELETCERRFEELAKAARIASLEEAEERAQTRREAEMAHRQILKEREAVLSDDDTESIAQTIAKLTTELKTLSPTPGDRDERPLSKLRAQANEMRALAEDQRAALSHADKVYNQARAEEARADDRLRDNEAKLGQLRSALQQERSGLSDEVIQEHLNKAILMEQTLSQDLAVLAEQGGDPEMLKRQISMHQKSLKDLETEAQTRRDHMRELETQIRIEGGRGLGERLEEAQGRVDLAKTEVANLKRDASALKLLFDTLKDEQAKLKDRFTEPVRNRLQPLIRQILPDAVPLVDTRYVSLGRIERSGQPEELDDLSVGTREQLAVLTRLAFADLLFEKEGDAPPIILDDALVYADEDRFDRMKLLLSEAANRHQIIILTCRPRDYRGLDAKTYDLSRCRIS